MSDASEHQEPDLNTEPEAPAADDMDTADAPPVVDHGNARRLTILSVGVVLALLLVVIIVNLNSPQVTAPDAVSDRRDPIELITPKELTEQDLSTPTELTELGVDDLAVEGGWIQVTDQHGQLAQQYRFERLDPNPAMGPGWAALTQPEAELFLSDNRVVVLTGDNALAYSPSRALESGSISGNVVIRLYELEQRRNVDDARDTPSLVVHTNDAQFDSVLGEIYCAGDVEITSTQLDMPGRELRVLLNDSDDQVSLRMTSVSFIRLRAAVEESDGLIGNTDKPAEAVSAAEPGRMYSLVLNDDLSIRQLTKSGAREIHGDRLTAVFSADSAGIGDALATALGAPDAAAEVQVHGTASNPLTSGRLMAAMAIASAQDDHSVRQNAGETIIRFDGPLVLSPWLSEDDAEPERMPLRDSNDVRITIEGQPVTIDDSEARASGTCAQLTYQRSGESIEMLSSNVSPLLIRTPDLTANGDRLLYTRSTGRVQFVGAGWITPAQVDEPRTGEPSQDASSVGDLITELQITWKDGVDLQFDSADNNEAIGALREVRFAGGVEVKSEDGDIYTDDLRLRLKLNALGQAVPEQMIATGGVKTADPERTMWADELIVDFQQAPASEEPRVNQARSIGARVGDDTMIRNLRATGDVQVRLVDGSRAFADELIGDGVAETLELRGEHVVVAAGRLLLDRGKSIKFDGKEQLGRWNGPGQLFMYDQPIETGADKRIERPAINHEQSPPTVRARWNEAANVNMAANDGAGEIILDGDVSAESRPSPREFNRIEGQQVTLTFRGEQSDGANAPQNQVDNLFDSVSNRQLEQFTARGNAKLENRLWRNEDQSDRPRVFYVAGPLLEYNDRTFEARVIGSGELLFRDIASDTAGSEAPAAADPLTGAFRGKGTTLFRWRDELTMQQIEQLDGRPGPEEHLISIVGEVTAIHRSTSGETATLTGDEVDAHVIRIPAVTDPALPVRQRGGDLDLGGSFDLRRIVGRGSLAIEARRHTVMCDLFDYNLATGIAEARADGERVVSVLTADSAQPLQAGSILWDLPRDVITIRRGSGGG